MDWKLLKAFESRISHSNWIGLDWIETIEIYSNHGTWTKYYTAYATDPNDIHFADAFFSSKRIPLI